MYCAIKNNSNIWQYVFYPNTWATVINCQGIVAQYRNRTFSHPRKNRQKFKNFSQQSATNVRARCAREFFPALATRHSLNNLLPVQENNRSSSRSWCWSLRLIIFGGQYVINTNKYNVVTYPFCASHRLILVRQYFFCHFFGIRGILVTQLTHPYLPQDL